MSRMSKSLKAQKRKAVPIFNKADLSAPILWDRSSRVHGPSNIIICITIRQFASPTVMVLPTSRSVFSYDHHWAERQVGSTPLKIRIGIPGHWTTYVSTDWWHQDGGGGALVPHAPSRSSAFHPPSPSMNGIVSALSSGLVSGKPSLDIDLTNSILKNIHAVRRCLQIIIQSRNQHLTREAYQYTKLQFSCLTSSYSTDWIGTIPECFRNSRYILSSRGPTYVT